MINIAILGFGTVGSGVYEIVKKNGKSIGKKINDDIAVKYILDIRDFSSHEDAQLFTKNYDDILNDDSVNIVVEVIGGLKPAYDFTKMALEKGKHVVTSNKELVATHGADLFEIAKENGVNYMYEASVGGGIPIIRPLGQCLAANEIKQIFGILNGTTNYILTQMIKEGKSFEVALADAQAKGYAERNPDADVNGHDACRKISILASLAFGKQVDYNKVSTEGIANISLEDVKYADKLGYVIKLIGYAKRDDDKKVFARVSPMLLPNDHQLAGVVDVFNAILIEGDSIGDVMFYGRGAGKLPTASAVMADVIDIAKNVQIEKCIVWKKSDKDFLLDVNSQESVFFVRVKANDVEAINDEISELFENTKIVCKGLIDGEVAFITPRLYECDIKEKLSKFDVISAIRMIEGN